MITKTIETLIILAVAAVGFLVLYYRQAPPPAAPIEKIEEQVEAKEPPPQKASFVVEVDSKETLHVGILGESRSERGQEEAVNSSVLRPLLQVLKDRKVNAIFFTGNLVAGISDEDAKNLHSESTPELDATLSLQLAQFSKVFDGVFGGKTPFFPTIGSREAASSKSSKTFLDHFRLENVQAFNDAAFGYTVSMGPAFFAVISTDEFQNKNNHVERVFGSAMREWLKTELKRGAKNHRYLFVVGHEPAFSTQSTFADTNEQQRDAFWKILVDNKVLAYFASHETLFDRSTRSGVWQIISGGGGSPFEGGQESFYHCLLLSIPQNDKESPKIEVLDVKGETGVTLELISPLSPLYQYRISSR
jgi:hypothetical protein